MDVVSNRVNFGAKKSWDVSKNQAIKQDHILDNMVAGAHAARDFSKSTMIWDEILSILVAALDQNKEGCRANLMVFVHVDCSI